MTDFWTILLWILGGGFLGVLGVVVLFVVAAVGKSAWNVVRSMR